MYAIKQPQLIYVYSMRRRSSSRAKILKTKWCQEAMPSVGRVEVWFEKASQLSQLLISQFRNNSCSLLESAQLPADLNPLVRPVHCRNTVRSHKESLLAPVGRCAVHRSRGGSTVQLFFEGSACWTTASRSQLLWIRRRLGTTDSRMISPVHT
jgi:hypothetical protein